MLVKQVKDIKGKRGPNPGLLRAGDSVIVISGGNKKKRPIKGVVGKLVRFVGVGKQRVIVEGVNMYTHHKRARTPQESSGRIQKEGSMHVSNVMYYVEKLKSPVRLKAKVLADGKRVRGYVDPSSKEFVQI